MVPDNLLSFSPSAKGICIWLEVEFVQLCPFSCHSYSQCSEPRQNKVTLLQKGFHTRKICVLYSQTDSLMHYLVPWAHDQSKGYLAEIKLSQGAEGNSDSKSTFPFGIIPHRIIQPEYKRLKRHFQQWHTMVDLLFVLTCSTQWAGKSIGKGIILAIPKTTGNQLSQHAQLIKNCEY